MSAIEFELLLCADDSVLLFTHEHISIRNGQLKRDSNSLCEWFVDNKFSIHLGEGKKKSILFTSRNIKIGRLAIQIKQHTKVTYLGCILSGQSMATKGISKINCRIKFLYRKNKFLTSTFRPPIMQCFNSASL